MSLRTIAPRSAIVVPFTLKWTSRYEFHVEAEYPVDVFLVDPEGLEEYEDEEEFEYIAGKEDTQRARFRIPLRRGQYYLIIENFTDSPVAARYLVRR